MGQRVLVVDDDKFYGNVVAELLNDWGYDVVKVDDAEQAMDRSLGKKFHIALLEHRLPGEWSGTRLATALLRKSRVVGMSKYRRDEIGFTAAGVAFFLRKPFGPKQLFAAMKLAVAQPVGM